MGAAQATVYSVVLGAGQTKDGSSSLGASFAGTQLSFDTASGGLTIDLKNAGAGTITAFSLTLNESTVTGGSFTSSDISGCTGGSRTCKWNPNDASAFNDAAHDGFRSAAVHNPFDLGVKSQGNKGLQSPGESAEFVFTLTGDFSGVTSFFDIVDPFDEKAGNLQDVFWVGHVQELVNGDSVWIGGSTTDTQIPEPLTLALFGSGLVGLGLARRRRRLAKS